MNLLELQKKVNRLVEQGLGNAVLIHTDSRSGVSERTHMSSTVHTVDGSETDFYVDLEVGDTYISFYEGN